MTSKRTILLILLGFLCAAVWLMLLEATAFNSVVIAVGLLALLLINPQARRVTR